MSGGWGYTATKQDAQTWWQMRMRLVISMDGLAWYLILTVLLTSLTCQRKCKQKMGKGKEKRQFLTEKASDRESFGLFRHDMANYKHHTQRRFPVRSEIFQSIRGTFLHYARKRIASLEVPTIRVLPASLSGWNDCPHLLVLIIVLSLISHLSNALIFLGDMSFLFPRQQRVVVILHWSQHGCISLWYMYLGAPAVLIYTWDNIISRELDIPLCY